MNKCLVTKLNGSVNNNAILKLGEMRFKVTSTANPSGASQLITFNFNKDCEVRIIGDGYITDSNLSANKGKSIVIPANTSYDVYFSNGDYEVSIADKYSTVIFKGYSNNASINIEDFKYSNGLIFLWSQSQKSFGDVSCLKDLVGLANLSLSSYNCTGKLSDLSRLTSLTELNFPDSKIEGDLSEISDLASLQTLYLPAGVSGNVSSLAKMTSLAYLELYNSVGDLSQLPANVIFTQLTNCNFTWSERPASSKAFAINNSPKIDNIDKMLIDLAKCQSNITSSTPSWEKIISATGTRTSASDAAVQTLQSKGYSVSINPA